MSKRVLSVGQCVPDQAGITRLLKSRFDVEVIEADTGLETLDLLRKQRYDLVLINRKLDIDYSDGTNILRNIKSDPQLADVPVMLVTNYPEHQENAVAAGAERGFGKAELGSPDVVTRLERFLA